MIDKKYIFSIIDPALLEADACVNRSLVFCSMETKIGIWASTDPHMREYRRQYADQCHQGQYYRKQYTNQCHQGQSL